jgi:simple sugar transport system ATP-binding protein/ribose transport system ATP-binding protein
VIDVDPYVEVVDVGKRFGGVQALADVTLTIARGEIHGLVGENGAGKSTLGKIIAGVHSPDAGELRVNGRPVSYRSPRDALADGITMIAQEIVLVPKQSVAENVFLAREPHRLSVVDRRRLSAAFGELNERAGFALPAEVPAGMLPLADQQKVEILRALARDAELIVMDEPTAALTANESEKLFEIIRDLKRGGTTIVYVSHFLDEVLALVDTVSVLRDGELVRTAAAADETPRKLVHAMIGRSLELTFPPKQFPAADAPVVFSCEALARTGVIEGVSLEIRRGEIVGLAGLVGSGRSEVVRAIFGADQRSGGSLTLAGRPFTARGPRQAVARGVALLPESRSEQGLVMARSVLENLTLPHLGEVSAGPVIDGRREGQAVADLMKKVDVRARSPAARMTTLSGGNQQKALFAKWLFKRPLLLLADEPTRGVDVGAKQSIYALIHSLAADGMAVLVISSEHEEVIGLAHRVLVMRQGRIVAEFDGRTVTESDVLSAAFATEAGAA